MSRYPSLKRWLAAAVSAGVLAVVVVIARIPGTTPGIARAQEESAKQDWPMYGGTPSRNMVNTVARGLPTEWSAEEKEKKNIRWVAELGSKAYGGPVVAGGRVFVGTNNQNPRDKKWVKDGRPIDLGVLMCFAEKDGQFEWQMAFPKLAAGRVVDWPLEGLCSSPLVEGDTLYFVSNRCEVVSADAKSGKPNWKLDMIKELNVFPHNLSDCSPLLVGDALWVVTSNGVDEGHINVPSPTAPSFIKVNKKNGKVLWQDNEPTVNLTRAGKEGASQKDFFKRLVNRGELIQHGQWSNPAHGVVAGEKQIIFPGGDGWIRAFDEAGKLLWKFDCNPKDAEYELQGRGTRSDFIASPVVYKNRVYIGVGQDPEHELGVGHLWCIDMNKRGDVSPTVVTDDSVWPPKTKDNPNSAMVWHYGGPADAAVKKATGRNYVFGRTMSTCAIHDGLCYAGELDGWLHCLDAETGKLYWQHDTGGATWSSPYWADNKVYMGNDSGDIYVFAHSKEKKVLAQNSLEGCVRAAPVAANGALFVMTETKLYCIAEEKK